MSATGDPANMAFLTHRDPRPLATDAPGSLRPEGLFLGGGAMGLEVLALTADGEPQAPHLRALHRSRTGNRATPVVVVVLWGENRAAVCAPVGDDVFLATDADRSQVERLCDAALAAPDRHAARRLLGNALPQLHAPIPGLRNAGLFAIHELQNGVPRRDDWRASTERARPLLSRRGRPLIEGLGFAIEETPGPWSVLLANGTKVAVALFLERPDEIEPANAKFDGNSPVSYALQKADQQNLDYVIVLAASTLRVYPVKLGVGVGRRGRTETYVEMNLDLVREVQAAYLWLVFSAEALSADGTFTAILSSSADYAAELGIRLRERVYHEVVPPLARALVSARRLRKPSAGQLRETYDMALRVLFRLLFVAYAEDKELLPLHTNRQYRAHSLKEMARRLAEATEKGVAFGNEDFYWTEVIQLWKAVDKENRAWGVPPYNGGLFSSDPSVSPAGAALVDISLPDREFAPALAALLVDENTAEGVPGPVDFRSLGVREFGSIYEGLLESELSVAESDLSVDPRNDAYIPAAAKAEIAVREGEVYLHNRSGARKATGAYYTKDFAVDHLLDHALEPALDDHLARLDATYDKRERATKFFDFHVADIAMGSGHFLVAAVDRIERKLSNYLAKTPLPGVTDELERLRKTAAEALGPDWAGDPIEDTQLLRRQIARRCIFGVDLNPLAVELARLSIWIHSFVPGLPLSLLDQNLVVGNSLVGIATFEEASEVFGTDDLFAVTAAERLAKAREPLERLARLADATGAEIREARQLHRRAREATRSEEALLTVLTASRLDQELAGAVKGGQVATRLEAQGDVFSDVLVRKAEKALAGLEAMHFPIVFPQVFLGETAGFDAIVGNPPWEKKRVEELEFWARHFPGLRSAATAARERQVAELRRSRPDLVRSLEQEEVEASALRDLLRTFPGMNTGHPDLFRAFTWRFCQLVNSSGGRIGVVLPGDAFKVKGAAPIRDLFARQFRRLDLQMITNKGWWLFDDVHPQKLVALVVGQRSQTPGQTEYFIRPEVHSRLGWRMRGPADIRGVTEPWLRSYSASLVIPIIPAKASVDLVTKLMRSPRISEHPDFPVARVYADFETTKDRDHWSPERRYGHWPVYKGESFDLWTPDTGDYFAYAPGKAIARAVHEKRGRVGKNSPYYKTAESWRSDPASHPVHHPRIAFRDVTNRTNRRTLIAALIPPKVITTQTAPWILWYVSDQKEQREALLLGILCSLPLDWWARRFVEGHVDAEAFNCLRLPAAPLENPAARRIAQLAGRLAAQDDRFAEWAKPIGVEPKRLRPDEQDDLIAEVDASVALLYGLEEVDLVHIFETFHEGWDYAERLRQTLGHFGKLRKEW